MTVAPVRAGTLATHARQHSSALEGQEREQKKADVSPKILLPPFRFQSTGILACISSPSSTQSLCGNRLPPSVVAPMAFARGCALLNMPARHTLAWCQAWLLRPCRNTQLVPSSSAADRPAHIPPSPLHVRLASLERYYTHTHSKDVASDVFARLVPAVPELCLVGGAGPGTRRQARLLADVAPSVFPEQHEAPLCPPPNQDHALRPHHHHRAPLCVGVQWTGRIGAPFFWGSSTHWSFPPSPPPTPQGFVPVSACLCSAPTLCIGHPGTSKQAPPSL